MTNINNFYFESDGTISITIPFSPFEFQLWYGYIPKLKVNTEKGYTNILL